MKRRALAFVLTLMMLVSVLPMAAFAASYTDISGHWAESSIERWTKEGVLNGVGDGRFAPDDHMTRAEASAVFTRLLKLTATADLSQYTDVEAGSWYESYMGHALAYKIMNGVSDTSMDPQGLITREQFFVTFARAIGITEDTTCKLTFNDMDQLSPWAQGRTYALINLDYVNGMSTTILAPKDYITRAQVAKILDRAVSDYLTSDGTYAVSGKGVVVITSPNVALTGDFNGRVAVSADNAVLDLQGINGTPKTYFVKPGGKVVNGPVGTWVSTSPVADGQTANGVGVAPDTTYIIPAPSTGSSSSNSTSDRTKYKVTATLAVGSFTDDFTLSKEYTGDQTLTKVANDLIGGENKTALVNAIDEGLSKTTGHYAQDGWTVDIGSDGVIVVSSPEGYVDMSAFIDEEQALFEARRDRVADTLSTGQAEFNAFADTMAPNKLFTTTSVTIDGNDVTAMQFLDADGYYAILKNAVDAGLKLQGMLPADEYENVIGTGGIVHLKDLDTATLAKKTNAKVLSGLVGTDTQITKVLISENVSDLDSAVAAINNVTDRNFGSDGTAQAILKSALEKTAVLGAYTLTFQVEKG